MEIVGGRTHKVEFVLLLFVLAILVQLLKSRRISAPVFDGRSDPEVDHAEARDGGDERSQRMPLRDGRA